MVREIAKCPKCDAPVRENYRYKWCLKCAELFPKSITALLPFLDPSVEPSGDIYARSRVTGTSKNPLDRRMTNVKIACAAALIAGFFMPWVSIWGMGIPGYKIPELAQGFRSFGSAVGIKQDPRSLFFLLPYLIPILAFSTIINLLGQSVPKKTDILAVITGIAPILGLIYGLSQVGLDLFQGLAVGAYWTLTAAVTSSSLLYNLVLTLRINKHPRSITVRLVVRSKNPASWHAVIAEHRIRTTHSPQIFPRRR